MKKEKTFDVVDFGRWGELEELKRVVNIILNLMLCKIKLSNFQQLCLDGVQHHSDLKIELCNVDNESKMFP